MRASKIEKLLLITLIVNLPDPTGKERERKREKRRESMKNI
jgi:hypothetical protein